jgi:cysteine-rich repeat protein
MVVDNEDQSARVFDLDTHSIVGTVKLGLGGTIGDCTISGDQSLGFVTDFRSRVWMIDLTGTTPQLLAGENPIPISNPGEDTSLTPNRSHVVVCDGALTAPISVIDIAQRSETEVWETGADCNSVDVCADGSVLMTSKQRGHVRRFLIASDGTLADTGEVLATPDGAPPNNVTCATDGRSGVVLTQAGTVGSFTVPGLELVSAHEVYPSALAISGTITAKGDRLYVRVNTEGVDGAVAVFAYDAPSGAFDPSPVLEIPISSAMQLYGVDQLAVDAHDTRVFISQPGAVDIYDTTSGALVDQIGVGDLVSPSGVCLPTSTCGNGVVEIGEDCDDGNLLDNDCCSANCRVFEVSPSCDDGNACTQDVCSNDGFCLNQAVPTNSCFAPGKAFLRIKKKSDGNDRVAWKWGRGDDTLSRYVGDPTQNTAYTLCLFDENVDGVTVASEITVQPGENWTPPSHNRKSFRYNDPTRWMRLRGDQANIPDAGTTAVPRMFEQYPKITAELRNTEGSCWGASFFDSNVKHHTGEKFVATMSSR